MAYPYRSGQPVHLERPEVVKKILACMPGLMSFAIYLCRNRTLAEDLVQDTVESALKAMGTFVEEDMYSWLCKILSNRFKNQQISNARHALRAAEYGTHISLCVQYDGSETAYLEEEISVKKGLQRVLPCIATIKPGQADAVIACFFLGMKYDEAALILNCPVGTIRSRIHCARKYITELLEHGTNLRADFSRQKTASTGISETDLYYPIAKAYEELYAAL